MSLYQLLEVLAAVAVAAGTVGGVAYRAGRSGRVEPALATWRELATALQAQNAEQQHQIDVLTGQQTELRALLVEAKAEIGRLNEQVTQRAAVEELTKRVDHGFVTLADRIDHTTAAVLAQVQKART